MSNFISLVAPEPPRAGPPRREAAGTRAGDALATFLIPDDTVITFERHHP